MTYALVLGAMTLAATVAAGYPAVELLRRRKIGKEISEWAPETHQSKAGTPTMGGLLIVLVIVAFTLAANFFGRYSIGLPLLVAGCLCALGFVDDVGSLQGRRQAALQRRVKLAVFIAVGIGAAIALYHEDLLDLRSVNIPFEGRHDIGWVYIPVAIGIIVLTAGGVAVTDGLDGLAAGTLAIAYAAYGILAMHQEQTYLGAFCFTVTGACAGFLWHNAYPARVFMGDTGALALGGALAVVAFMTGQWLVLPLIGIIFVVEGASVGLQVGYFRLTGGKRIFRKTPLHHHFEEGGLSEMQTTMRFWVVGVLGAMAGVALALEVYS
ncbi:MAG TPA: phospho-N-acetylmuramoyl-pentapeptide-transferase [Dehalococcoidia bacterium]|nr:phospho-N-acetylmuramoyl-pentapeptide-transferase [Dehalococcoidia bacterium]